MGNLNCRKELLNASSDVGRIDSIVRTAVAENVTFKSGFELGTFPSSFLLHERSFRLSL